MEQQFSFPQIVDKFIEAESQQVEARGYARRINQQAKDYKKIITDAMTGHNITDVVHTSSLQKCMGQQFRITVVMKETYPRPNRDTVVNGWANTIFANRETPEAAVQQAEQLYDTTFRNPVMKPKLTVTKGGMTMMNSDQMRG